MRFGLLLLAFLGASGTAFAADDLNEMRMYDSGDYAGLAYYRMDFGGADQAALRQTLGFRMDNERALRAGAPALLKAELDSAGTSNVLMNGVNLSAIRLAAAQNAGGFFASMTVTEIITASVVVVLLGVGTAAAAEDDAPAASGTGGTGAN